MTLIPVGRFREIAVVLMIVFAKSASAADLSQLLGSNDALQCYHSNGYIRCKNLKSGEDWRICKHRESREAWPGSINRDAEKLTCENGMQVIVVNLDGGNLKTVAPENTSNAHFWRDENGDDWVVYTGLEVNDRSTPTWMVKIDRETNEAIESTRKQIADVQYSCGLNGSGKYLGEAWPRVLIMEMETGRVSSPTGPCMGSIHPGDKPWMMHEEDAQHKSAMVNAWDPATDTWQRVWYSGKGDGLICQWSSTNERYATFLRATNPNRIAQIDLGYLTFDTSGTDNNDGSHETASMGIEGGMIGGVWVGTLEEKTRTATPVLDPPAGKQPLSAIPVTITCMDPDVEIYYTIDGSEPNQSSSRYTEPFTVEIPEGEKTVVKARAYSSGLQQSYLGKATYTRASLRAPENPAQLEEGIRYEYYEGDWESLPDFDTIVPVKDGLLDKIDFSEKERDNHFGFRFTGFLKIDRNGFYSFRYGIMGEGLFRLGNQKILHADFQVENLTEIGLEAGYHKFTIDYYRVKGRILFDFKYGETGEEMDRFRKGDLYRTTAPVTILSPQASDLYAVGDTMGIRWETVPEQVSSVEIHVSFDAGVEWHVLSTEGSIDYGTDQWGLFRWPIPETLGGVGTRSENCFILVKRYNGNEKATVGPFSIGDVSSVASGLRGNKPVLKQPYRVLDLSEMNSRTSRKNRMPAIDVSGRRRTVHTEETAPSVLIRLPENKSK